MIMVHLMFLVNLIILENPTTGDVDKSGDFL